MNIQELDVVRLKDGREWHGVVDTYNQADEFEDGEEESIDICWRIYCWKCQSTH